MGSTSAGEPRAPAALPPPLIPPALSWEINPAAWAAPLDFAPPGDFQAGLACLAVSALSGQTIPVAGLPECEPVISFRRVLGQLGVQFVSAEDGCVDACVPATLAAADSELDCGLEFEPLLLATGLAAGLQAPVRLRAGFHGADDHLLAAVVSLLGRCGIAAGVAQCDAGHLLTLHGGEINPIQLRLEPAWQCMKPLLLLLALQAQGASHLDESGHTPDHLERAAITLGAAIEHKGHRTTATGHPHWKNRTLRVPADLTAAAPLIVATVARAGRGLAIAQVGANPGRVGLLRGLVRAGAAIERQRNWQFGREPVTDLRVTGAAALQPIDISPGAASLLSRELLVMAAAATQATQTSRLAGAGTLRGGLPDRLTLALQIMRDFGAAVELAGDNLLVHGGQALHGAEVNCAGDRQLGLLGLTLALIANGPSTLHDMQGVASVWPALGQWLMGHGILHSQMR